MVTELQTFPYKGLLMFFFYSVVCFFYISIGVIWETLVTL